MRSVLFAILVLPLCSIGLCAQRSIPLPMPRPPIREIFVPQRDTDSELPLVMPQKACAAAMRAFNASHPNLRAMSCTVESAAAVASGYRIIYREK